MTQVQVTPIRPIKGHYHYKKLVARRAVQSFLEKGHSNHSSSGSTLQPILDHCHAWGLPYKLSVWPGRYFYIELDKASLKQGIDIAHAMVSRA